MEYQSFCNTEILFSNMQELEQTLLSLNKSNIVLVMSESSVLRWGMSTVIKKIKMNCEKLNGRLTWIKEVAANPTQKDIVKSLKQIGNRKLGIIIACGGGSAIDLAKGISAFHNNYKNDKCTIDEITDRIKNKKYSDNEFVDIIAVPTTAGTGSEVTQWATIWDENKHCKFSIDSPQLKPKKAIIVPALTLTVSPKMTLSTGLDSMCQAIEAYWSKHTTPIVQEIAYRSVELVIRNLQKSVEEPNDIVSRENLCRASILSGLAFSQTRTTACHSISYPLTILYNIPHGLAVSITLDKVAKINAGHFPNDKQLFSLFHEYGGIKSWLDTVSKDIVTMRLSTFGIIEDDLSVIIDNAFTSGRMDNNPVDLTKNDVKRILESII
ncbi:phosphonoacetaldehyde reductase [Domibacillus robiginosus]|uniref:phosphonoacetaldehyde reductase n=1 Tax=Domibacillus robiginosus TaxID=1071054 RepID=UPI00067C896C|nr:phosphonoacetaldehyde reductase [Domibacillus robiginosus]